jgi:beta-N-acetylhexosaminidase
MAGPLAAIFGCAGTSLTNDERAFFRDANPWGFIVFARNIENPKQIAALTAEMRDVLGRNAPVLVDQEGGRVQRLRPPHWRDFPPAMREAGGRTLEEAAEAHFLRYLLIADELHAAGIDVNCAPLLDVATMGLHPAIGERALGSHPAVVAALGHAVRRGLAAGGVLPVIKHLPGYGRSEVDPHESLPVVRAPREDLEVDFAPFRAHNDALMGMTAHLTFDAIDDEYPVTFSGPCIDLIREDIGFGGLLMTDDISMGALAGTMRERTEASIGAGCDIVLHCNGKTSEMADVAAGAGLVDGDALRRVSAVDAASRVPEDIDIEMVDARYRALTKESCDA